MERLELIKEQTIVTKQLINFMLLRNQWPRRYGADTVIYMAEADIIAGIGRKRDICASDIAKSFGISKSAVSKTIRKLCRKGIVTTVTSPNDSRKRILVLTPKGRTIYRYHNRMDMDVFEHIMRELSKCTEEELQAYIKIAKVHVNVRYHLIGLKDGTAQAD